MSVFCFILNTSHAPQLLEYYVPLNHSKILPTLLLISVYQCFEDVFNSKISVNLNESHCDLFNLNNGRQFSCQPLLLCYHGLTTFVCLQGCVACRRHICLVWFWQGSSPRQISVVSFHDIKAMDLFFTLPFILMTGKCNFKRKITMQVDSSALHYVSSAYICIGRVDAVLRHTQR